ncbi:MAG TPA: M91 family zinc metallopeptidase [Chthoniobacterales bacterium]|nr:M91 family zinc metallopeptidase [Chthoniobacterales bacterium]
MTLRIDTTKFRNDQGGFQPWFDALERGIFQNEVEAALAQIRSTQLGSSLLMDIQGAGKEVAIIRAAATVDNKCVQQDPGLPACDAACYQEVLNVRLLEEKIQQLLKYREITRNHPAVKKYDKFFTPKAEGGEHEDYVETLQWGEKKKVQVPIPIAHKRSPHTTSDTVRQRVREGQAAGEVGKAVGYVKVLQWGLIGYHIMDHLTPGQGTGAWVVWNRLLKSVPSKLPTEQRAAWMERPTWIALAHELIHGWRLVTGRCVFKPGLYIEEYCEEAMTVGLPPYDGCKFTENKFRISSGQPLRGFYGEETRVKTEAAQQKHKGREDDLVWAPGQANPPYDRLLRGKLTYKGQSEEQFKILLEAIAVKAAINPKDNKRMDKNLRVLIFGPREQLDEIIKWTESTIRSLNNRFGYEFRISRVFFDAAEQQVRFYDHLRSG